MKKDQGILICESILLEFDPITMAAGGAALGVGIDAAKWAKQRLGLRREMQSCKGNPECVTTIRSKIAMANKNAIRSGVKHAALGSVLGGFAGTDMAANAAGAAGEAAKSAGAGIVQNFKDGAPMLQAQMTMLGANMGIQKATQAANKAANSQQQNVQRAAEAQAAATKRLEDTKERAEDLVGQARQTQRSTQQTLRNGEKRQIQSQQNNSPRITT